jgi:O-antigen ligase
LANNESPSKTEVVLPAPLSEAVWRWGQRSLGAGLLGGLALIFVVAWRFPEATLLLPVVVIGLGAGTVLFKHPELNLAVLLSGFVLAVNSDPGIQVTEVVYGLYYYAYLFHWYGTRLLAGSRIARSPLDHMVAVFIVAGGVLGVGTALLFGTPIGLLRGDLTAFLMLALYFPVKELCRTYHRGPEIVVGVLLWLGVFLSWQTFRLFRGAVQSAVVAWQVADVRFGAVETLILIACFSSLILLLYATRWRERGGLLSVLLFALGALILTRGRTFWVAFALGVGLLLVLLRGRQRIRLVVLTVLGGAGLVTVALLFFGQVADLIFSGTLNRLTMINTQDISMQARFVEWRAVWERIVANPILGYGFGTTYEHFDILSLATLVKGFVHNGYLATWYKLGVFGLLLLLLCWGRALFDAIRVYRDERVPERHRAFVLIAFVSLITLALAANASIFFLVMDQIFAFALLTGLVSGLVQRSTEAVLSYGLK